VCQREAGAAGAGAEQFAGRIVHADSIDSSARPGHPYRLALRAARPDPGRGDLVYTAK
jgi:hypothetical protein